MLQGEFMKEVEATASNDGLKVIKPILKGGAGAKAEAGAEAEAGPQPQEKKIRFADESPELSPKEKTLIKDFSTAFDLKEDRMTKIFQDSKTPKGIQEIDKAYLVNEGAKNEKFKESGFFKGLLPENDKNNKSVNSKNQGDGLPEEDPRKKLNNRAEERGDGNKGGEEKKGGNKKLMLALGLLFIACIFLATGGAALPIIGGFLASSQGLLIVGAVGAGLAGAGLFIKDQISQGNNNPGGMKMVEGAGAQGQGQAPAPEKAQGQGQAQENAQAPAPEKAPATAPDLMKLMKQDLQAQRTQLDNEKDILRGFKQELDSNVKLSNLVKDATSKDVDFSNLYKTSSNLPKTVIDKLSALPNDIKEKLSQVDKIEPDGIAKKSSQALSKDIGIDSKSEKRTLEDLNLEKPKSDNKSTNTNPSSEASWASRMLAARGGSRQGGSKEI